MLNYNFLILEIIKDKYYPVNISTKIIVSKKLFSLDWIQ